LIRFSGIGRDLVRELVKLGAFVIGVSRSAGPLNEIKEELKGGGFQALQLDLSDWNLTRETLKNLDVKLDGIVNNAGIAIIKPFSELTEDDFDQVMNVNLKACFNVVQSLLPKLKDGASIVNISSLAGLSAFEGHSVYSASKSGLDALTKSLAVELGPRKIRVNSINPTVILTRMGRENWSDPKKAEPLLNKIPLRRFGEVKEVVDPIIFLLSDNSSFINGTMMPIEGGFLA
jgi:L-xylulose reductase